jgi:hypothetical protein
MSRSGTESPPSRHETAAELRARATHVRQLARELINAADRRLLLDFAQELEARAATATDQSGAVA